MNAAVLAPAPPEPGQRSVFELGGGESWWRWRERKLAARPRSADDLVVEVRNPLRLDPRERAAIVERCRRANMAIYATRVQGRDEDVPLRLGAQLGLATPETASGAALARIAIDAGKATAGFIPYTNRRMRWHTDGYYRPPGAPVRAMILHCVRPALAGGATALLDPELAWILLRDEGEELAHALTAHDAFTIPEHRPHGRARRAAVTAPVFAADAHAGDLVMRYTARRRHIQWRCDATTEEAAARLLALMDRDASCVLRVRLEAGMGLVCNNVLHERGAFEDTAEQPRLLLRARFLERIAGTEGAWLRLAA